MFEVTAIGDPLNILTLELDLRLENATDLSVEVYSLSGQYAEHFNQPDAWDLVAATQVVVTPGGGGAVIPAQDFTPVRIGANERQSFYVTMKGPYLDHTVYALQKTGDIQSRGDDLQVFVGAGLTEYKFPEKLDDILNPMFAGVIHYEKEYDCGTVLTSTTYLDFPFLFEESVDMRIVTMAINKAVDELLKEEDGLKSYVSRFGLQKRDSGETEAVSYSYTCKWCQHLFRQRSSFCSRCTSLPHIVSHIGFLSAFCPSTWEECPPSYLHTRFRFTHEDSLSRGLVLYEFYRYTEKIIDAVRSRISDTDSVYIGFESVANKYAMTLNGVPVGAEMDGIQLEYFAETTERFLAEAIRAKGTVYNIQVDNQVLGSRRRLIRSLLGEGNSTSIEVQGIIRGALPSTIRQNEFRHALQTAFSTGNEVYVSMLSQGAILPGDINDGNRHDYFQDISGVSSHFQAFVEPGDEEQGSSSKIPIGGIIGGIIAGLSLLFAIYFFRRHRKQKQRAIEVEEYREKMREERRAQRLMKANSKQSDFSDDNALAYPSPPASTDSSMERKKAEMEVVMGILEGERIQAVECAPPAATISEDRSTEGGHQRSREIQSAELTSLEGDAISSPVEMDNQAEPATTLMSGARKARNHERSKEVNDSRPVRRTKSAELTQSTLSSESPIEPASTRSNSEGNVIGLAVEPATTLMSGARKARNHQRSKEVEDSRSVSRTSSSSSARVPPSPRRQFVHSASLPGLRTDARIAQSPVQPQRKTVSQQGLPPSPRKQVIHSASMPGLGTDARIPQSQKQQQRKTAPQRELPQSPRKQVVHSASSPALRTEARIPQSPMQQQRKTVPQQGVSPSLRKQVVHSASSPALRNDARIPQSPMQQQRKTVSQQRAVAPPRTPSNKVRRVVGSAKSSPRTPSRRMQHAVSSTELGQSTPPRTPRKLRSALSSPELEYDGSKPGCRAHTSSCPSPKPAVRKANSTLSSPVPNPRGRVSSDSTSQNNKWEMSPAASPPSRPNRRQSFGEGVINPPSDIKK